MASIAFSQHLQTHVDVERSVVEGGTVREALDVQRHGSASPSSATV